jgi:two-component system, NtrC family, response regulator HupR/HoxA
MIDLRPYGKLHTIAMLKDVVRRWWGVELAFADARGYCLDHAEGKIIPPLNDYCRQALFSKDGFRRCNESVKAVRDRLRAGTKGRGAIVHECHLGFDIIAAPIVLDGELAGFLFVGGSTQAELGPTARGDLLRKLREVAPPAAGDPDREINGRIPRIAPGDVERVMDLLEHGVSEIQAYFRDLRSRDRELQAVSRELGERYRFENIVGNSRSMQDVYRLLEKIVASESTVLIHGESGTGKELVARAIHYNGPRAKKPFVVQNCSAFNDNLLESALFGHSKGAFTGAVKDKKGLFEVADGGTFFLDEVGDMSPALQVKLLRVLQEGTFTPVGTTEVKQVDVRVIAATHKDLQKMVERGEFREDLYYRINVIKMTVPPLRDRLDDLPLLCEHFLRKHHRGKGRPPQLAPDAIAAFQRYAWPGNIRELENEIERLLVLGADLDDLPHDLVSPRVREAENTLRTVQRGAFVPWNGSVPAGNLKDAVEALEREMINQGLIRTHWNKSQLAKELGISRSNLIQKCTYYGLDRKE